MQTQSIDTHGAITRFRNLVLSSIAMASIADCAYRFGVEQWMLLKAGVISEDDARLAIYTMPYAVDVKDKLTFDQRIRLRKLAFQGAEISE